MLSASPLQKLESPLLKEKGISLMVKRDDLIHPEIQGNKWRKLKYNLAEAVKLKQETVLTFGGYYSNHIYATAAAASYYDLKSIGIIRGERPTVENSTLKFARSKGMHLFFIPRAMYALKDSDDVIDMLKKEFGSFYLIPEGGTNLLALKGVSEMVDELPVNFDYLITSCGTSGTLAGIVAAMKGAKQIIGFSALKGTDTLTEKTRTLVNSFCNNDYHNFQIIFDYHFGGYASINTQLIDFISNFKHEFGIPLEPVYTGKMFYGLFDMVEKNYFKPGTSIVAIHTGGLQGLDGYKKYFS